MFSVKINVHLDKCKLNYEIQKLLFFSNKIDIDVVQFSGKLMLVHITIVVHITSIVAF